MGRACVLLLWSQDSEGGSCLRCQEQSASGRRAASGSLMKAWPEEPFFPSVGSSPRFSPLLASLCGL